MHDAMLLAPHAARFRSLMAAGLPVHAVLVIVMLVLLCAVAAWAVRLEGQR